MTHVESTIYEFRVINVKPEYVLQFYTAVQNTTKFHEKYGAKTLGTWLAEAGEVGTYYVLREWPSMKTRVESREKMWNDHEFQKTYKETFPMVRNVQSFLCKTPANMPLKTTKKNSHIILHKMTPKKFTMFAAQKYREMQTDLNKMIMPDLMQPIGTLIPLVYDEFCMITLWEVPDDKLDTMYNRVVECRRDPTNWEKMSEFQETFHDEMSILAVPVDATRAPRF
jgi:hypothetical protein